VFAAGGVVFEQLGSMFGQWISGQGVSKGDWIALGQSAATAASNILFLTLSVAFPVVGGVIALLGSFVSGIITALFQLTKEVPPSTGDLINSALAKERLKENKDFWMGMSEELESLGGLFVDGGDTDVKTAWYLIVQHDLAVNRQQVFGECLDSATWSGDTCKKYLEDGMLEVMVGYAWAHMGILWEILNLFMENPSVDISVRKDQVDILHLRMQELGAEYHGALQHAWEVYYPWRMSMIWNPYMNDVTQNYSWWQESWTYELNKNDILHPFDFLYAHTDQGYDALDLEFPVDRSDSPSYGTDRDEVKRWRYEGCLGERHDDLDKDGYVVNHACNLYQHITGNETEAPNGCHCAAGTGNGDWYDGNVGKNGDGCWSECMAKYIAEVDSQVNDAFGAQINKFRTYVQNFTFHQSWRATLGANGSQCADASLIDVSRCEDAFNHIGKSFAGTTTVHESSLPAGCSFRLSDNYIVINEAESGQGHAHHQPICGAMFFATSSDTLIRGSQLVAGEKLTSADGLAKLNMQNDGNLVVYDGNGDNHWAAVTAGNPDAYVQLENSGNLVVHASGDDQTSLWSSGEHEGATKLVLHNNCSLDIIGIHGEVLWTSLDNGGTNCSGDR